jgi:hypothetical protein
MRHRLTYRPRKTPHSIKDFFEQFPIITHRLFRIRDTLPRLVDLLLKLGPPLLDGALDKMSTLTGTGAVYCANYLLDALTRKLLSLKLCKWAANV